VFIALGIQRKMRMRHTVVGGLSSTLLYFLHCFVNGTIFGGWGWECYWT